MGLLGGPAKADPSPPSAHDVTASKKQVRDRAAEVGRINATLAQVSGRLDDLDSDAELAVERFNGARVKLDQAGQACQAALRRTAQARRRLGETRTELAVFAAAAYRTDNMFQSDAAVLGGQGGPQGFMERASMMQVLTGRKNALVRQQRAAETVAGMFETQAQRALAAQQAATRGAAAARQAAIAAVTRQRAAVKQTEGQKARLVTVLGTASTRAAGLARERDAALARSRPGGGGRYFAWGLAAASGLGAVAATAALKWLGTPYSWGGGGTSGPSLGTQQGSRIVGFDCSGLVTYAWARAGVRLVHYATAQYNSGPHPSRSQLRPGDLVFFAHNPSDPDTIHHVGIYIGHSQMVEAPFTGSHVRISYAFRPDYAGATRPAG